MQGVACDIVPMMQEKQPQEMQQVMTRSRQKSICSSRLEKKAVRCVASSSVCTDIDIVSHIDKNRLP